MKKQIFAPLMTKITFSFDGYHPSLEGARMINNLIMKKIDLLDNN